MFNSRSTPSIIFLLVVSFVFFCLGQVKGADVHVKPLINTAGIQDNQDFDKSNVRSDNNNNNDNNNDNNNSDNPQDQADDYDDDTELSLYFPTLANAFFLETFQEDSNNDQDSDWTDRWSVSKKSNYVNGEWQVGKVGNATGLTSEKGLILKHPAVHHAISSVFEKGPFNGKNNDIIIQYQVRFHKTHHCGGAYLKILDYNNGNFNPDQFDGETPYIIMFGPDKCGATNKVHFIFRHQSPVTKEWEEKHLATPPEGRFLDSFSHVYTLAILQNNTFQIYIDTAKVSQGNLLVDFSPSVNPRPTIDDPSDSQPADWPEQQIPDPDIRKPDDWDEDAPEFIIDQDADIPDDWLEDEEPMIADPDAVKPEDWDEEDDGEYVAPLVDNPICTLVSGCGPWARPTKRNPAYKGKWEQPMIPNPDWKGVWEPRQIENPNFFQDHHPHRMSDMGAIGIEVWTMQDDIEFDNILVHTSLKEALEFAETTWSLHHSLQLVAHEIEHHDDNLNYGPLLLRASHWAKKHPVLTAMIAVGASTMLLLFSWMIFCQPEDEREFARRHYPKQEDHHGHKASAYAETDDFSDDAAGDEDDMDVKETKKDK